MRVLLTNDDGIRARGLKELYECVSWCDQVAVVAPSRERSGSAHGVSVRDAVGARRIRSYGGCDTWAVSGTPVDCVKLAVSELLEWQPDFVISGINAGVNTGVFSLYSGTVAAAVEAAVLFGIPAMAVSLQIKARARYDRARVIVRRLVECVVNNCPQSGMCLNINIPSLEAELPRGCRIARLSTCPGRGGYRKELNDRGHAMYRYDGGDPEHTVCPDTDVGAVYARYVSVTPLSFGLWDRAQAREVASWKWPTEVG